MTDAASAVVVAAIEGDRLTQDELAFFRDEPVAGVTLFRRNLSPHFSQIRQLTREIQETRAAGTPPMIIAIDQEGGRVARLPQPFPNLGPAQALFEGRSDPDALLKMENYGYVVGSSLLQLGVNVNFAPVVDVLTNPGNDAIGDRVFGTEPESVSLRAGAFLKGMQAAGVYGCLKHFPGQGDAAVDTHLGSARVDVPLPQLETRELVPFQKLLPQAPMVMVSHCIYPVWDHLPASLSQVVMQKLLRQDLGYKGLVVSDDMNMGAIPQDTAAWAASIVKAVEQGADLILVCRHLDRIKLALEALRAEAAESRSFQKRLQEAAERVTAFRYRLDIG